MLGLTRCPSPRQRCLHDFLATTSHDARTPLSSIAVASQLLRDGGGVRLSDDASELLAAISASNRVLLTSASGRSRARVCGHVVER